MARELIILNTGKNKRVSKQNSEFKKILLNQDLLGNNDYEVIEVE